MTRSLNRRRRAALAKRLKSIQQTAEAQRKGAEAFETLAQTEPLPGGQTPVGVVLGIAACALTPGSPTSQGFMGAFAHDQLKQRTPNK